MDEEYTAHPFLKGALEKGLKLSALQRVDMNVSLA